MSVDEVVADYRARLLPRSGFDSRDPELIPGVPTTSEAHAAVRALLSEVARSSAIPEDMREAADRVLSGRISVEQLMRAGGLGGYRSETPGVIESEGIVWR
ncbi:hypothetical protein [Microbacterium sp.]|uniref:hypothetical protein n=1 Tax=Microbacterium sp. TaxID=51671 RepID=UPI0028992BA8|nr:hypothetical protein [Microbacterium sp.]